MLQRKTGKVAACLERATINRQAMHRALLKGRYTYDAIGRRVEKVVTAGSTTRFILDGVQVIEEYDGSGAWQARYIYEDGIDRPRCMDRADVADVNGNANTTEVLRFHYHQQALGSVTEISQPTGAVVEWVTYDVYGAARIRNRFGTTVASSAVGNPWLFTGRAFDAESGLYHYRARAYDASAGRLLQRDPLGYIDGLGLHDYVSGQPASDRDPNGLSPRRRAATLRRIQQLKAEWRSARQDKERLTSKLRVARQNLKKLDSALAQAGATEMSAQARVNQARSAFASAFATAWKNRARGRGDGFCARLLLVAQTPDLRKLFGALYSALQALSAATARREAAERAYRQALAAVSKMESDLADATRRASRAESQLIALLSTRGREDGLLGPDIGSDGPWADDGKIGFSRGQSGNDLGLYRDHDGLHLAEKTGFDPDSRLSGSSDGGSLGTAGWQETYRVVSIGVDVSYWEDDRGREFPRWQDSHGNHSRWTSFHWGR